MLEVGEPRAPREREVLIGVKAAGVGNLDEFVRTGNWDVGRAAPLALGVEAAGIVAVVGSGVERWSVGDEVLTHALPLADHGTWAPWLIARSTLLAPKPHTVAWADAGAFAVPALCGAGADGGAGARRAGDGGAGGEPFGERGRRRDGQTRGRLAAMRAAHVVATAGPSSRERALAAGAATLVDYHNADWPEQVVAATGAAASMRPSTPRAVAARAHCGR
jgi:NADPH:quinone reductase-like Zn-dependent oxidoreductase